MVKNHTLIKMEELNHEKRAFIKVIGKIIDIPRKEIYLIDDGTNAIHVVVLNAKIKGKVEKNTPVRVFGEVNVNEKGEVFINAQIIQAMTEKSYRLFLKFLDTININEEKQFD
ncbi:MAG: hypothetical protein ACP6IS_05445 [Candidatus Asgardarchaeia archaeon]